MPIHDWKRVEPGYTWGIVPALAHSGVRYLSVGPNHIRL